LGIRKRLFGWCPQPVNPISTILRRYSAPLAIVIATTVLLVSFFLVSSGSLLPPPPSSPKLSQSPTELWSFTANATTNNVSWQSGVVADGIAYVWNTETYTIPGEQARYESMFPLTHSLGNIYALNAQDGAKLWNYTVTGDVRSFRVLNGVVYVSASEGLNIDGKYGGGGVYAWDAASGAQKWVYKIDGDIIRCSISNGTIYVFFHASGDFSSLLCAVNATNGKELWRWNAGTYVFPSMFTIGNEAIYFAIKNQYYAINTKDGKTLWSTPVDGAVSGYSTLGKGVVYFSSTQTTYALNTQNGNQLWGYPAASYGISDSGILYNTAGDHVYAFDGLKGNQVWNYSADGRAILSLARIDNVVYFSTNGTLTALNFADGAPLWSSSTDVNGTLFISDGSFRYYGFGAYASVNDGVFYYYSGKTLYTLDALNGTILWNHTISNDQSFVTIADGIVFFDGSSTIHALSFPSVVHPSSSPTATPTALHPSPSPVETPTGSSMNLESLNQELIIGLITVVIIISLTIVFVKKRTRK
jgi:outer membrane protein assembly factor BamB